MPVRPVATEFTTGQAVPLKTGDPVESVVANAAYFFPYDSWSSPCDGGIAKEMPLSPGKEIGASTCLRPCYRLGLLPSISAQEAN